MSPSVIRVALGLGLAGALLADGRLDGRAAAERAASARVEPLVTPERKAGFRVAAITLVNGARELLYLRTGGVWRCQQVYGAPADGVAMQDLVDTVLGAEGMVQSDVPARFADYGIGTDATWRVTFHGTAMLKQPDKDVLFELELGQPVPLVGGCFARVAGEDVVRALDRNPRDLIEPLGFAAGATPLLDPHVVPRAWLGEGDRVVAIQVEREGGAYRIEMRERALNAEELAAGVEPLHWVLLHPDGRVEEPSPIHTISFASFTTLVGWRAVVDPARAEEFFPGGPVARVMLQAQRAVPLQLALGPPTADGFVPVLNDFSRGLLALAAEEAQLLMPGPEALLDPAGPNEWEQYLADAGKASLDAQLERALKNR